MKYMRRTAGYTWTDYKINEQIAKEIKITPILDKLLEYKRSWIHVNRMPRNRLPRVMKYYSPTGRRNHGRSLKKLLDTWDWNGSTSGPTPWKIYDDDELILGGKYARVSEWVNNALWYVCARAESCAGVGGGEGFSYTLKPILSYMASHRLKLPDTFITSPDRPQ